MPTRADRGIAAAAREVVEHVRTLARLEARLTALELREKARALGVGAGLLAGAALAALLGLGAACATAAAALALVLPIWLALLVVTLLLLGTAGALALLGIGRLRAGVPPVPERALEEARRTGAVIGRDGRD